MLGCLGVEKAGQALKKKRVFVLSALGWQFDLPAGMDCKLES